MTGRLTLRTRLVALVTIGALVVIAALTFAFNALLRSNLDGDANRLLEARAQAALETVDHRNGTIRVSRDSDNGTPDAQSWVFAGRRALERPPAGADLQALADSLAGTDGRVAEDPGTDTRLTSLAVPGGTVVSGISLAPYEDSAHRALIGSLILAAALLAAIMAGVRLVVGGALRPVARMTADAATWSETDLDHRFNASEPHDELTALAATFDDMLDRLAESLRHEQRLTAEVSHELRTPLAAIIAEAEVSLRRPRSDDEYRRAMGSIVTRGRELQRILEALLAAARAEAAGQTEHCDPAAVVDGVLAEQRARAASRPELGLERAPAPAGVALAADPEVAERILAPLVENACVHAAGLVRVEIERAGHSVLIAVCDDGAGVPAADRERIFEPGHRGPGGNGNGYGLGLALARRLARAIGGEIDLATAEPGLPGARFIARFPAA